VRNYERSTLELSLEQNAKVLPKTESVQVRNLLSKSQFFPRQKSDSNPVAISVCGKSPAFSGKGFAQVHRRASNRAGMKFSEVSRDGNFTGLFKIARHHAGFVAQTSITRGKQPTVPGVLAYS